LSHTVNGDSAGDITGVAPLRRGAIESLIHRSILLGINPSYPIGRVQTVDRGRAINRLERSGDTHRA
jgi:hypothetical protein